MKHNKTVIIVTGPTASGKTALAIQLAEYFNTSIISADSRQCFKELNIGVAKPSPKQLSLVKHYFINSHSVNDEMNAALFEKYALESINEIFLYHDIAIMVGGTGLYIKAFCQGMDIIPPVPGEIRENIIAKYKAGGLGFLQQELKEKDSEFWKMADQQNPQRLMRALEVFETTGKSIICFKENIKQQRDFNIIKIGIANSKETLYNNINTRVESMMQQGLLDEVTSLLPFRSLNALQTVGYKELFNYFDNNLSLEDAVNKIKTNTRHYAKRQLTWFRKDEGINWFPPEEIFTNALILAR